jgi:hypothetical protein
LVSIWIQTQRTELAHGTGSGLDTGDNKDRTRIQSTVPRNRVENPDIGNSTRIHGEGTELGYMGKYYDTGGCIGLVLVLGDRIQN